LKLSFGAGELILSPGASRLVDGTATYNYEQFKPEVTTDGGMSTSRWARRASISFHRSMTSRTNGISNSASQPMDLIIESGAYEGDFEFGGLALTSLTVKDGAADVELAFSEPNQTEMSVFSYSTGASNVKMEGLANANFSIFDFSAGAGDYTLDFSGELQRDASIKVTTGFSNLIIIVPDGVDAVVTVESGVSNVSAGSGWSQKRKRLQTERGRSHTDLCHRNGRGNLTLTR
jgi:hypothetical protein